MATLSERIDAVVTRVRADELDAAQAVAELGGLAQDRGGLQGRRLDGAFFTDEDVATHLVRRALGAWLLGAAGVPAAEVDALLADGAAGLLDVLVDRCRADAAVRTSVVDGLGSLQVLDPTCGAGSFLAAAWGELLRVDEALAASIVSPAQLLGVDLDADAVWACRAVLELLTDDAPRPGVPDISVGDAEASGSLPPADVVVGNPPFVRATGDARHADLLTRSVPNRSAWVAERALRAARPGARVALVLPISTACTDAFAPARAVWDARCTSVHASHFDTIPSSLFRGVVQRLTILEGGVRAEHDDPAGEAAWWTTRYHRWTRAERDGLLERVRHVALPRRHRAGSVAKVGTPLEVELLDRLAAHPPVGRFHAARSPGNRIHYKRRWSYFLLFTDFVPPIWDAAGALREPSELKALDVVDGLDARALLSVYSSSLFWWYFSVFTDNRNVNRRDLAAFPVPDLSADARAELAGLGSELMAALQACSEVRTCTYRSVGTIRNTYFRQGETRPVLDRIDRVLAAAYGLSEAQLQFVLEFEYRFRS